MFDFLKDLKDFQPVKNVRNTVQWHERFEMKGFAQVGAGMRYIISYDSLDKPFNSNYPAEIIIEARFLDDLPKVTKKTMKEVEDNYKNY